MRLVSAAGLISLLAASGADAQIVVGSRTLTRCVTQYDGYCGTITRPLDPVHDSAGTITIGFE
jgi:hypothetical protein